MFVSLIILSLLILPIFNIISPFLLYQKSIYLQNKNIYNLHFLIKNGIIYTLKKATLFTSVCSATIVMIGMNIYLKYFKRKGDYDL